MVLLNLDSYAATDETNPAAAQSGDYYAVTDPGSDEHAAGIRNSEEHIIGYLLKQTSLDPASRVFCEIGTGRGYATIAAALRFKAAYGLDFDLRHITSICDEVGWPSNLHVGRTLHDVQQKIDVLMGWHALEHIPQPLAFLEEVRGRMNPDGHFFFQVPLFRNAYIVRSHYVFFNETAMRSLMKKLGMNVVEIGFDTALGFLTVIAQGSR